LVLEFDRLEGCGDSIAISHRQLSYSGLLCKNGRLQPVNHNLQLTGSARPQTADCYHVPSMQFTGELPSGEAHVWLAKLDLDSAVLENLSRFLNDEEKARAARFKVDHARDEFTAGRALLRIVLGKYLGSDPKKLTFRIGEHGKPELAEKNAIHFNLSHTRSLAAIAVTHSGAIGVDVERVRENVDSLQLAERYFSKQESAWVRSHSVSKRAGAFFSCWTAKEAYIKALGMGLSTQLDQFAIVPDPAKLELEIQIADDPSESTEWTLSRLELSVDFRGAVAVHAPDCRVCAGWFSVSGAV
jgi:4'-phosphopantetheinyl transferase